MKHDGPGAHGRRDSAATSQLIGQHDPGPERSGGADGLAVSVILIVRNGERFIAEALDSVFRSDTKPLEVLVVDGGSTDRTVEIVRGFPLTRVVAQQARGIADAYNQGIAMARGDLVAFISYDDIWEPGKLDRQVTFMRQHPVVGYTVTMVRHFLDEGARLPPGFRAELLDRPAPGFIMEALVVRKSVFGQVGLFDRSFSVSEDTDWFARARDAGVPMAILPDVLVRKRVHGTNISLTTPSINALLLRAMRGSIQRKRQGGEPHAE
jgi:glycosyltransferase involved in cell wall biosynthesis